MIDAAAARESGFGTGLLAHLERGRIPEAVFPDEVAPAPVRPPEAPRQEADRLAERERILAVREAALEGARAELAAREAQLAAYDATRHDAPRPDDLRTRADRAAERVWSAFAEALEATYPDGRPDHAMRIAAAQALLAELRLEPPGAAYADELARRRELREASR